MSLARPVFKPHLRVQIVEPDVVFVTHDGGQVVLQSPVYAALAPLLDGTRTADDIVDVLSGERDPIQLYYALQRLEQGGFLTEGVASAKAGRHPSAEAAWWSSLEMSPPQISAASVRVHSVCDDLDPAMLTRLLVGGASSLVPAGETDDTQQTDTTAVTPTAAPSEVPQLDVVLTDDYLQPALEAWNNRALAEGRAWMLVKPVGTSLWIGPIFTPREGGCWRCLADRLRGNREVEGFVERKRGGGGPIVTSIPALDSSIATALCIAASHVAQVLAAASPRHDPPLAPREAHPTGLSPLRGSLFTLDLRSMTSRLHAVDRRPQCPTCGDVTVQAPRPIELRSVATRHGDDGGHRSATPEETVRRLERLVSPITGIVSFLEASATLDGCAHVYNSGHNFARMNDEYYFLRASLRSQSAGKGASDAQARASAIGEAVERYCGVYRGDEPVVEGTLAEIGEAAIHPNDCMLYSERQYATRHEQNTDYLGFNFIPNPYDPTAKIPWTALWSLTRQEWRYLPTAYCYYGFPQPSETAFCWSDSNGNAAGNTLEEAILQGLLELVERDAVALWWYNRLRRPAVDLDSVDDPFLHRLRNYYQRDARELWVLDITSDLGVPTFTALSRRVDGADEDIIMGFGAHPDARVAVRRALTEMNQSLSIVRMWSEQRDSEAFDVDTVKWWRTATVANQPYLLPNDERRVLTGLDWGHDLADAVRAGQSLVEARGLEVLVLDQSRPDVGLSVVKVVVPGLRHFWARFAPGRLYDVPVRLGWLASPLEESQMNPIAMFL